MIAIGLNYLEKIRLIKRKEMVLCSYMNIGVVQCDTLSDDEFMVHQIYCSSSVFF